MRGNKKKSYEYSELREHNRYFWRLIIFVIISGFLGGVILIYEIIMLIESAKK